MSICQEINVPSMSGGAFSVSAGQTVRIVDVQGGQPGDLVAFKATDFAVRLSQSRTRVENRKVAVTQGDCLWTNSIPPEIMFTITADTSGPHDLLYTPCCRYALEKRFNVSRDGCLENLVNALKAWDVAPHAMPDPLNLFFRVAVDEKGGMSIDQPTSRAGSFIEMRAAMDCIVAVSTCSVPFSGKANSDYQITVFEEE